MATKHGLAVFNSDGNVILDVTDRLTKISGEADIIPANPTDGVRETGTIQCDDIVAGMNFWYMFTSIILPSMSEPANCRINFPTITRDGNGYFTWKYPNSSGGIKAGVHIIYGVS